MQVIKEIWRDEKGIGTVEMLLILVGLLTPYYGGSIKCIT